LISKNSKTSELKRIGKLFEKKAQEQNKIGQKKYFPPISKILFSENFAISKEYLLFAVQVGINYQHS
jgi:hypothetical protein